MKHAGFVKFAVVALAMTLAAGCTDQNPQSPVPNPIDDSAELIQVLANAYRTQDYATFASLFCGDFLFILDEPNPDTNETQWNLATELRIHQRMFDPQTIPPGDPPLPPEHWLDTILITLTAQGDFVERPDLYNTFSPPGPLDPAVWIARSATYSTDVFFQLQGETDFQIRGRADFTVLEDRSKQIGDAGKFCIYRWEDLGSTLKVPQLNAKSDERSAAAGIEEASWAGVKSIYA